MAVAGPRHSVPAPGGRRLAAHALLRPSLAMPAVRQRAAQGPRLLPLLGVRGRSSCRRRARAASIPRSARSTTGSGTAGPIIDIERWLKELAAEGTGYPITRQALARHAHDHVKVEPKRGRRPPAESFLQAVVDTAQDALEEGTLRVTARDAISAQAEINRQSEKGKDRDLMLKIALALTGQSLIEQARIVSPEQEALEAEFRPLLTAGN
jgi:hypothetical protein